MRGYTLKALKTFSGREGQGFSVTLVRDGIPWIDCLNEANGGSFRFSAYTPLQRARHDQVIVDARQAEGEGMWDVPGEEPDRYDDGSPEVADAFTEMLVGLHQTLKDIERKAKIKVLFTRKGDCEGVYYEVKAPYSAALAARLREKEGARLDEMSRSPRRCRRTTEPPQPSGLRSARRLYRRLKKSRVRGRDQKDR